MSVNNEYKILFQIAKLSYLEKIDESIDKIDICYNNISSKEKEIILKYTKIIYEEFKKIDDINGLCIPLSICLLEVSPAITKQQYSFLTFGIIEDTITGKDIFLVGEKEDFLKRYNPNEVVGGNIHAWITLSDGTIIDPSINFNSNICVNSLIIGSPAEISKEYKYSPYIIGSMIENFPDFFNETELDKIFKNKLEKIKKNYKTITY